MQIPIEHVSNLSFPDCSISNFLCDGRGNFSFTCDGLFVEGLGFFDAQFDVKCAGDRVVLSRRFIDEKWIDADPKAADFYFIGEWITEHLNLRLAGFENSGAWREYCISVDSVIITPGIPLGIL